MAPRESREITAGQDREKCGLKNGGADTYARI
ncbi:MAG: hypothetical protein A4E37_02021 [Methanoregulaceae archaeon PtaB.Bin056]|nr:MAG: hypothetical protein A4E37_02021 [Methanoregulaceae archaeon PtaB.Bin056]